MGEYPHLEERLEDLSRGTGATAPGAGLDCDGDGRPDIAPGAPLVCSIPDDRSSVTSLDLATPLQAMLRSLVAEGTATVTATAVALAPDVTGRPLGIVVSERYPGLDLGRAQQLPFHVTVTCPVRPVEGEYHLELVGRIQAAAVATAGAVVRCAAAPVVAVAAAAPLPAVASAPAPASVAQVAPASHPAAQAVAALAPQEEPALAEQGAGDYAFARSAGAGSHARRRGPPIAPALEGIAAVTIAAGLALRRQAAFARARGTTRRPT